MTSVLARVGQQLGTLVGPCGGASQWTQRSSRVIGKRKRGGWACQCCTRHIVAREQKRWYNDDALGASMGPWGLGAGGPKETDAQNTARDQQQGRERFDQTAAGRQGLQGRPFDFNPRLPTLATHEEESSGVADEELWEDEERTEDATEEALSNGTTPDWTSDGPLDNQAEPAATWDEDLLQVDYVASLPVAIKNKDQDMVARCLLSAQRVDGGAAFIQAIDPEAFTDILRIMQPTRYTTQILSAHVEVSEAMTQQLGLVSSAQIAHDHASLVEGICKVRSAAPWLAQGRHALSLEDFRLLLRSAAVLGRRRQGQRYWRILHAMDVTPDIECYNYYMSSVVWNNVHQAEERQKIRVIPAHSPARRQIKSQKGSTSDGISLHSMKQEVTTIFGMMLQQGLTANEESFRILISAAAREGDIDTVKTVLQTVWSISVDAIMSAAAETEIPPPLRMKKDNPQCPTPKMLFAVAHAFCINNDIPTALRLIDFVARYYKLEITQDVWDQLFEWTYVLAIWRTRSQRALGYDAGLLPMQSVQSLWDTMTGPPYLIRPTMGMYNRLIRNLAFRQRPREMLEKMLEAQLLDAQHYASMRETHNALVRASGEIESLTNITSGRQRSHQSTPGHAQEHVDVNGAGRPDQQTEEEPSPNLSVLSWRHSELCQQYEHAELISKRNLFWLKRWVRLLLGATQDRALLEHSHPTPLNHRPEATNTMGEEAAESAFNLSSIPRFLWEWRQLVPTKIWYEVPGGRLEFLTRSDAEMDQSAKTRMRVRLQQQKLLSWSSRLLRHDGAGSEPALSRRMAKLGIDKI